MRGTNNGTGRDPDASARTPMASGGNAGDLVGSIQEDAFQGHHHNVHYDFFSSSGTARGDVRGDGQSASGKAKTPVTDGVNGAPRFTAETRPKNANVNFIIKY